MNDCVFCKINEGELPAFKIHEDKHTRAFLDVNSASQGHLLVIPKKHYENIFDVPEEELIEMSKVIKKMSLLCKERLNCSGINILNASGKSAQQSVMHLHFHVVPRFDDDGMDLWFHGNNSSTKSLEETYNKLI